MTGTSKEHGPAMPFRLNGKIVFVQLDKDENMNAFDVVLGIASHNPDTPVSEVARIFKEYKEWKNEHQTTT